MGVICHPRYISAVGRSTHARRRGTRTEAGKLVWLYDLGVRFMVSGAQTGGRFALVEHPIRPKALAAPLHTHADEDEISYVLEGEVGMQIGDRELRAGPGTLVFKPRGVPHAFWNPGEAPARMLELISPAGFERYFEEAADLVCQRTTRCRIGRRVAATVPPGNGPLEHPKTT